MANLHIEPTSKCTLECPLCDRTWFYETFKKRQLHEINVDNIVNFVGVNSILDSSNYPVWGTCPTSNTDTIPPVITLNGSSTIQLNVGDSWTDPGATATDETDGDITVGISRESATYQRLIGVTCKLTITKSLDVNVATVIVDIGGAEYAPVIVIKDPGDIEDGEQIEATIRCNAPYDIDNNPSDDSKSADYNEESSLRVSGGEILTTILVASILVVIAFFAGLLQIKDEKDEPKTTNVEIKETEKVVEEIKVEEEIDDFNFEFEEEIEEQLEEVIDLDEDPVIIEETVQKEPDNSASGRLASLRDELDDDDVIERRPLRDRMDDFFNN